MAGMSSRDPRQSPSAAPTLAAEGPHPDRTEAVAFQPGASTGNRGASGDRATALLSGELPAEFGR